MLCFVLFTQVLTVSNHECRPHKSYVLKRPFGLFFSSKIALKIRNTSLSFCNDVLGYPTLKYLGFILLSFAKTKYNQLAAQNTHFPNHFKIFSEVRIVLNPLIVHQRGTKRSFKTKRESYSKNFESFARLYEDRNFYRMITYEERSIKFTTFLS